MLTAEGFRLDGRVAVVTGSGRNIGQAAAESFAAAGAKVVVNGHNDMAAIETIAHGIRERGGDPRRDAIVLQQTAAARGKPGWR